MPPEGDQESLHDSHEGQHPWVWKTHGDDCDQQWRVQHCHLSQLSQLPDHGQRPHRRGKIILYSKFKELRVCHHNLNFFIGPSHLKNYLTQFLLLLAFPQKLISLGIFRHLRALHCNFKTQRYTPRPAEPINAQLPLWVYNLSLKPRFDGSNFILQ